MRRVVGCVVAVAMSALLAGCATGRAFARGEAAGRAGDWESAVGFYRQALQNDPDRPDFKIALERAMVAAAQMYFERGRQFEASAQPEEALRAYRKAQEFEPSNRQLAIRAADIERTLRDRLEASTPRPDIERMRQQARRSVEPVLSPTNPEPLIINFVNTGLRDILTFIGNYSGINVTFDRDFQDRSITLKLEGVSLEQGLQQIMIANQLFYKVLNERTIIVSADSTQKRTQYEEQMIRTFFISNADATELSQLLTGLIRVPGQAVQPQIVPNKTANTITIRGTGPVVQIAERIIEANDKPRAEVVVDVQILEVSRERAKRYGLDLGSYSAAFNFSPEAAPSDTAKPFNLNTISQGVSTGDFYLSVPSAVVRFLESDSQTKVLAKPNLRGTEGQKLTLNLGEEVPVPSTTFTPLATGGGGANPLVSYGYRPIGINVEMTPRVTYDGDVILEITVENSARGQDTLIAGQSLPSFVSRKVATKLRLRDGESNLLAGLLREDERRSLTGFPALLRLPILKQLFSNNEENIRQTDIVMLLTPRIIRTHELKASDLSPIYIGTQSNMSIGGPPPVIGGGEPEAPAESITLGVAPSPAAVAPAAPPGPLGTRPPAPPVLPTGSTQQPVVPPGSSPIPGLTTAPVGGAPQQPAAAPSPIQVFSPPPDAPTPAPAAAIARARAAVAATELRSVRTGEMPNGYAITLSGNGALVASSVEEAKDLPNRVLLDFHNVAAGRVAAVTNVNQAGIERVRVGTNSRDPLITRVVIDLARKMPYTVETVGEELRVVFNRPVEATAAADTTAAPTARAPEVAATVVPSPPPPAAPQAPAPQAPTALTTAARITLSPPSEMRVGGGPYTVPISVAGATRLSTITISITYNPALVRVRSVQEGTFMRQGGVAAAFSSQVDEMGGRIDIVITRPGDQTGASTSGLLAALLLDPLTAGTGSLLSTGSATVPGGASAALQFLPAGITVR